MALYILVSLNEQKLMIEKRIPKEEFKNQKPTLNRFNNRRFEALLFVANIGIVNTLANLTVTFFMNGTGL